MRLKKNGARLVSFVIDFANGNMSRREFDLDYSGSTPAMWWTIFLNLRKRIPALQEDLQIPLTLPMSIASG